MKTTGWEEQATNEGPGSHGKSLLSMGSSACVRTVRIITLSGTVCIGDLFARDFETGRMLWYRLGARIYESEGLIAILYSNYAVVK